MAQMVHVIDDDTGLRTAYAASLHKLGFEVETAADGLEALELLKKGRPDLVLLDLLMPNLDGLGYMRKLREDPANASVKAVVTSNFESVPEAAEVGVSKYLSKVQHGPDEVAAIVQQVLSEA